ncbi:MAG: type II 3-dehydroquinate dehydratase [Eubacteriales bacterium]
MGNKDTMPVILLINGPNLNMLGKRSKEHYGSFTLSQVEDAFRTRAKELGVEPVFFQSNDEGGIVTAIQESMGYASGIVINAGAYTHYSYAILDALLLCGLPVMEVHISNIHKREQFRSVSVIQAACVGQISGLGLDSYLVGLEKLVHGHVFPEITGNNASRVIPKPENASPEAAAAAASEHTAVPEPEQTAAAPEQGAELSELRKQISQVDVELMNIFNRRMDLAEEIAHTKIHSKTSVYDARREAEVSDMARRRAGDDMATRVDSLMKTMMRISREKQYDILMPGDRNWKIGQSLEAAVTSLDFVRKAAYAGTRGSYSEQAAQKLFPDASKMEMHTFSQACELVLSGEADVAVLPLENTTAGTVDNVYELLQKKSLHIVRATSIAVAHTLAVIPGTKLSDIRTVTSHPQAISQCSEIICRYGWDSVPSDNTAFAAEEVKKRGDSSLAAISSEESARRNGLEILPVEICNAASNQTRFIAVAKELVITPDADRISTLMHLPHRSGALVAALEIFADRGLNLTSIFSRPIQNTPGEYSFFLDFVCPAMGKDALLALYQLSSEMPFVKVLGWYVEE